jgi:hypothetical protein
MKTFLSGSSMSILIGFFYSSFIESALSKSPIVPGTDTTDCVLKRWPATYSDQKRPLITIHSGQRSDPKQPTMKAWLADLITTLINPLNRR